jgi:hypothetical protein
MISWTDIPGATGASLVIDSSLTQSSFYRRKVTETNSRSIGYSDAASVLVIVSQPNTVTRVTYFDKPLRSNNEQSGRQQLKMDNKQAFYYTIPEFELWQRQRMKV